MIDLLPDPGGTLSVKTSTAQFLVLHALKVKGLAPAEAVAVATGLTDPELGELLDGLVAAELVRLRGGRVGGYGLTPSGRAAHADRVAAHLTPEATTAISTSYEAFLPVNGRFKVICTRWQIRPGPDGADVANDHSDAGYDAGVVDDLAAVHEQAVAALAPAGEGYPRFGRYPSRFAAALERVRGGEVAAFARPMNESYHDVWMELHEDFLLLLRRDRGAADGH